MYFHPKDEYIYYLGNSDIKQRLTDRSASHFGRFAPQTRPMGCAICTEGKTEKSLDEMTVTELHEVAKAKGITGYSSLNKEELLAALKGA